MGKRGFPRREPSPKEVLTHCLRLAQEVAPPTPKGRRGRPWRYAHALYLALLLFRVFYKLTYRKTEALLHDLMEEPFPSPPSLARYALHHLDPSLLEDLLHRLAQEVEAHLPPQDPDPLLPHGHHRPELPERGPNSAVPPGGGGAAGAGA
ncbi:hypothetical protein [Thermus sp. LT1-2-5]|uniref:hypothetical protein n=1 Tax=Thermus sp. LT1-2-5 TaxID=3026935 RepID=UPI0033659286